mgnify:CR=1 FL=1
MDMKKYLAALQAKEATQQANFGNDAGTQFDDCRLTVLIRHIHPF